jgi:hypothetical protein
MSYMCRIDQKNLRSFKTRFFSFAFVPPAHPTRPEVSVPDVAGEEIS